MRSFQETHYGSSIHKIAIPHGTPSVLARAAFVVSRELREPKAVLSTARPIPARIYPVEGKIQGRIESAVQSG